MLKKFEKNKNVWYNNNIIYFLYMKKRLELLTEKRKVGKMKQKRRKLIFLITMLIVVISTMSSTITVNAAWFEKTEIPIPQVQQDVYVYDEDNIIDDTVEQEINALLIQLEEQTGAEVAVVTVESLLGKEIEDYSIELANTLGIGKKDEDNGVLLLISRSDERVRLEIGKGLEGCLNDSKCGRMLDNYFVPYREEDEYSEGTKKTVEAVVAVIADEYETIINGIDANLAQNIKEQEEQAQKRMIIIIIIIAIIIAIILASDNIFFGGVLTEVLLSGGGSSSGGGFGGGSFGGGGASR